MEEYNYLIILYDYYGELLTDKQRKYFEDYYFKNLSLGEISENELLSRNAIHKNIKSAEEKLYFYEEKLGLYQKKKVVEDLIKNISNEDIKNKIREILWRIESIRCIMIIVRELVGDF